jgi:hypothetical protein
MSQRIEFHLDSRRDNLSPEENDGQHFEPVTIRFKLVYTTAIRYYTVCPDWNTRQLMEFIRPYVIIDFGLTEFDIIVSGQPLAERANALRLSSNIKVSDITNNMNYLCFYIRTQQDN